MPDAPHIVETPRTLSRARTLTIYGAALAALFMAVLDVQIVATALPTIAGELGNLELFGWVSGAYVLTTAVVTMFYGKLADLFGTKRIAITAITLFTLGSLACGTAWSMQSLIAARVLQGLGGGGLFTIGFIIIAELFEPRERAKFQGWSTAVFTLAGFCGPVTGGLFAQTIGWEYIFLVNLPVGIAVIVIIALAMPPAKGRRPPKIDYAGGLLLGLTVILAVLWTESLAAGGAVAVLEGWIPAGMQSIGLPVLALIAAAAFVAVERQAAAPVLPLHFFTEPTIWISLTLALVVGMNSLGMMNYFALFLQTVTGLSPALVGLLFLPSSIGASVSAIGAGILVSRTGRYKPFPIAAMAIGLGVQLVFTGVDAATPVWFIGMMMFLFPFAIGLQNQTLMVAVQHAAPPEDVGAVTGAITLARLIGASFGLALFGGLLNAGLDRGQAALPAEISAQLPGPLKDLTPDIIHALPPDLSARAVALFATAFHSIYYVGAALFAFCLLLSLMLKDTRLPVDKKRV